MLTPIPHHFLVDHIVLVAVGVVVALVGLVALGRWLARVLLFPVDL